MSVLSDPWTYEFMVRALVITTIASVVAALLSAWLIHIGWSLLGDAVSHAVLPGVVIAPMVGLPYAVGAMAFGLLAVGLIQGLRDTTRIKGDTAMGVVFSTLFAGGLMLMSVTVSEVDRTHILFGNMLGISTTDAIQVVGLSLVAAVVIVVFRRRFTWFAFDRAHMASLGRRPALTGAVMLVTLAVVAVASLQAVGVVLVVAMVIIPGATAHLWSNRLDHMLVIAPASAVVATVAGLYGAFYLDTQPGPTVVAMHGVAFALSYLVAPYGAVRTRRRRRLTEVST